MARRSRASEPDEEESGTKVLKWVLAAIIGGVASAATGFWLNHNANKNQNANAGAVAPANNGGVIINAPANPNPDPGNAVEQPRPNPFRPGKGISKPDRPAPPSLPPFSQ